MWLCRVDRRMGAAAFCRTGNHFWMHALTFSLTTPSPSLTLHSRETEQIESTPAT